MKTRSKPSGSRSRLFVMPLRMFDGSLLTPERIRELHAQLDEVIRSRDTNGVITITGLIELTWQKVQRDANDGEAQA